MTDTELVHVPIGKLTANARNPRRAMDEQELEELTESIREQGILQPLVVTPAGEDGHYLVVVGHRRHQAAIRAGLETVPCVVREISPQGQVETMLVENLQRADLTPIEEAEGYRALIEQGLTGYDIAKRLGKPHSSIYGAMRLLKLPESVQQMLQDGQITPYVARHLLKLPTASLQHNYAMRARIYGLTAARLGVLIDRYLARQEPAAVTEAKERRKAAKPAALTMEDLLEAMAARKGALTWPALASVFRRQCGGCDMREESVICQECPALALGRALLGEES